ncbi:hypothetical protein D3C80_2060250 [compost metagenome]
MAIASDRSVSRVSKGAAAVAKTVSIDGGVIAIIDDSCCFIYLADGVSTPAEHKPGDKAIQ